MVTNAPSVAARVLLLVLFLANAGCSPASNRAPQILLFTGTGTSPNDVKAFKAILDQSRLEYAAVNSGEFNSMSESQLTAYRLLIIPGGNFIDMGNGLKPETAATIRRSVQGGLNYLGVCAGGFLAGDLPAANGFNLTSGVRFGFYSEERRGIRKAPVLVSCADGPALEHYWEDGPEFTGWGDVVGKYPDGTPAIVQGTSGKGGVILCGVHPEAPENWRRGMAFTTSASATHAYAATLIDAALHNTQLPRQQ